MSIKLYEEKELYPDSKTNNYCPAFICEWCHRPVTKPNALYFWYTDEKAKYVDRQIHVAHKGECERQLNRSINNNHNQMWDDITDLLVYLIVNTGILDNENETESLFEKIHDYLSNKEDN